MWRWGFIWIMTSSLAGLAGGWLWSGMAASLIVLGTILWQLGRRARITVPDETMAVIVDPDRARFLRLLPPGRHRLRPFVESVESFIPLGTETATGSCQTYSDGGLPLTIGWQATYRLEPERLALPEQGHLAQKLARKHGRILENEASASVQHLMSTTPLQALLGSGGRSRLERGARQAAAEELARLGICLKRLRVVTIDLPADIQATLVSAHERAVQAESEAHALTRLQAVIGAFTEQDMVRLTELERLRLLGQNGVAYSWPGPTVIDVPGPGRRRSADPAIWN